MTSEWRWLAGYWWTSAAPTVDELRCMTRWPVIELAGDRDVDCASSCCRGGSRGRSLKLALHEDCIEVVAEHKGKRRHVGSLQAVKGKLWVYKNCSIAVEDVLYAAGPGVCDAHWCMDEYTGVNGDVLDSIELFIEGVGHHSPDGTWKYTRQDDFSAYRSPEGAWKYQTVDADDLNTMEAFMDAMCVA